MTKRPCPLFDEDTLHNRRKIFHRPNLCHDVVRARPNRKDETARRVVPGSNLGILCASNRPRRGDMTARGQQLVRICAEQIWEMFSSLTNMFR